MGEEEGFPEEGLLCMVDALTAAGGRGIGCIDCWCVDAGRYRRQSFIDEPDPRQHGGGRQGGGLCFRMVDAVSDRTQIAHARSMPGRRGMAGCGRPGYVFTRNENKKKSKIDVSGHHACVRGALTGLQLKTMG